MTSKKNKKFFLHFLIVSATVMGSRILGLIRDIFFASFLGAGFLSEIFLGCLKIMGSIRRFFEEGAITNSFVPIFSDMHKNNEEKKGIKFSNQVFSLLFYFTLFLIIFLEIFMPQFAKMVLPGFASDPEKISIATLTLRLLLPATIFISLYVFINNFLQVLGRFLISNSMSLLMNTSIILATVLFHSKSALSIYAIASSFTISFIIMFITTLIYNIYKGQKLSLLSIRQTTRALKDKSIKLFIKNILPAFVNTGITIVNSMFATFYAGGVAWIYYSERLALLPFGVVGVAISNVLLPYISGTKDLEIKKKYDNQAFLISSILIWPCAFGMIALGHMMVSIFFQRGAFTLMDTLNTNLAMTIFLLSIPFSSYKRLVANSFYKIKDTSTPVKVTCIGLILNIIIIFALKPFLGFFSIPAGFSISTIATFFLLYFKAVQKDLIDIRYDTISKIFKIIFMSFIMYAVLKIAINPIMTNWQDISLWFKITYLLILSTIGASIYFALLHLTKVVNIKYLKNQLLKKDFEK